MPLDFSTVKEVTIPEGACNSISINGITVWERDVPIGYTKLDYVTANGNQHVETNITVTSADNVQCKVSFTGSSGNVFGSYISTSATNNYSFYGGSASADGYIRYGNQIVRSFRPTANTVYEINMGASGFTANGNSYATFNSATFTCGTGFWLCMLPNSSAASFKGKFYGLKITNSNGVVADFVPAQRDSDNKKGIYDRVGHTFYLSDGSSDFT